jgi:uncharacterized protein (DUF2126 family)/transglutaminase-like putative cysteine protease
MGKQVALHHRTEYRYDKAVTLGPQVVQLRPAPYCRIPILSYALAVTPADRLLNWQLDPHSNWSARLIFPSKTTEFVVDVRLVADLTPINPFDFYLEPGCDQFPFAYAADLAGDLEPYCAAEAAGPLQQAFLDTFAASRLIGPDGRDAKYGTVSLLLDLNRQVRDTVGYTTRMEAGIQSCEQTLALRSGSCRDSAWLLVQLMRSLGLAARFVSGYLIQLAADSPDSAGGLKSDSADLHAWAEAYLPGAGWVGLDPTSGMMTAEGHIPLVSTPSASKAAPISGTAEPANVEFSYSMTVERLYEAPRVTRPFSEEEWERVEAVALAVDAALVAEDVRLTMGGEPTFVGIDEPESPQWNIDALGPVKRTRGLDLIRAIREQVAPGALLHFGQGKWYPGEPLPRWALSCYWRADGVPVWENPALIATESASYGFGLADAQRFGEALTRRLQVSGENLLAAYNFDSGDAAGYVLPIRRREWDGAIRWSSQLWFERPERLVLSPGDSPIGFRIPTEALPWVAPDALDYAYEPAPLDDKAKLPAKAFRRPELFDVTPGGDPLPALASDAATATVLIRTALCVEAREGRMHVFLPFASQLADYLDMVAAVEDTAAYLQMPVWVEGYTPPIDGRLRFFSVTPDPGVLEINLPPAADWPELVRLQTLLFAEAAKNRLTAEKFNYDGTHLATGGGSHIVVGGATVFDSPFLRRPELLRSMVAFWQNHPSLSYLFSGLYVGPTSQYPRVDEARLDALYELDISFANLPKSDCPAWVVDGLFRNLLVDLSGNAHRAEFCIDKMFPPEGQGLQLGLVELRGFEMAPHLQMSLLQSLLVRALIAMFWKTPFEGSLIRWGANLHDRFMLPHCVERDLGEVLAALRRAGFAFEEKWFGAQVEFRFPKLGSVSADGLELELRHALEPWNVLAEETVSGSTVRTVDSSMERLQVKLSGVATDGRYVVACNGRRVPLTPTGTPGESVAGVRYRARRLSKTLHPTIPVHAPLVFDLIDTWATSASGKCAAQCTYFVGHPQGSLYNGRPANAEEAEARRSERFQVAQTLPTEVAIPAPETNPIFPMTLDLRLPLARKTEEYVALGPVDGVISEPAT